jgi:mono/diheme cytochrome c family protein
MNIRRVTLTALGGLSLVASMAAAAGTEADNRLIERGKYLARVSGCNDCHTPGYMESSGKVPVQQWLTGSAVGFQGPWGTTYPSNLRLAVSGMTEAQWLARARTPMRPPMPWFNLSAMSDRDLIALYRFVRSLGPAGEPTPQAAAPGVAVATPYFEFTPKNLPALSVAEEQALR